MFGGWLPHSADEGGGVQVCHPDNLGTTLPVQGNAGSSLATASSTGQIAIKGSRALGCGKQVLLGWFFVNAVSL